MPIDVGVLPGDGIGPEVIKQVVPLLETVAADHGAGLATTRYEWGAEHYLETGELCPDDSVERLADHDAILVGAVGHPDVDDAFTLRELFLPLRKQFDLYVNERPSVLYEGIDSPLRGRDARDIDFVVYRENTEGEYADVGGRVHEGFDHEVAVESSVFTREGVERVARAAFEAATERNGRVTNVTKSNVLGNSMVFWDEVVEEVATEYPNVELEHRLVDAASMALVNRPEAFDVVLASNLFGDIVTDLGAAVTGSIGLAPSANLDPTGRHPSMFEPIHGSAPDIAGEGVANPIGTVLAGAMLFDHVGDGETAETLRTGVAEQLADSTALRTPDIGGEASTEAVVDDLRNRVE